MPPRASRRSGRERPTRVRAPSTSRAAPTTVTSAAWRTIGWPAVTPEEKTAPSSATGPVPDAPRVSATATPASTAADRYQRRVRGISTAAGTIQRPTDQRATRALRSASSRNEAARSA